MASSIGEVSLLLESKDKALKNLKDIKKILQDFKKLKLDLNIAKDFQKELDTTKKNVEKFKKDVEKNTNFKAKVDNKELDKSLKSASDKLKKVGDEGDKAFKKIDKSAKDASKKGIKDLSDSVGKLSGKIKDFGGKLTDAGRTLTVGVTAPIVAGFGAAIKTAIDFEDAFAGVVKTVDGLSDAEGNLTAQGEELKQGLRDIAKEAPISFEELATIAELAGQLGVRGSANIEKFTDSIAKIAVATNLTSEEAATAFAQIANVLQDDINNVDRYGSSIVALGNNFATTERDITNFSQRIAGAGAIVDLSASDIFGLSAAFTSVGVEAEAGGTAVQKTLLSINDAVISGGDNLELFAKTAGLSAEEFKQAWEDDAANAFTLFVNGLGKEGDNAIKILDELELKDQRLVRAFLSVAGAGDLVNQTLATSREEFEKNTALQDEARKRFNTTANQIKILGNNLRDLGATIGEKVLPIINDLVGRFIEFAQVLAEKFDKLPDGIQKLLIVIPLIAAAIGPVLLVIGSLITAIGTIGTALSAIGSVIGSIGAPILIAVGAIIALGAAFLILAKRFGLLDTIIARLKLIFNQVKNTIENIRAAFEDPRVQAAIQRFKDAFNGIIDALRPIFDSIQKLFNQLFAPLDQSIGDDLDESAFVSTESAVEFLAGAFEFLADAIEKATPFIEAIANIIAGLIDKVTEAVEFIQMLGQAFQTALADPEVQSALQEVQDAFAEVVTVIQEVQQVVGEVLGELFGGGETDEAVDGAQSLGEGFDEAGKKAETFKKAVEAFKGIIKFIAGVIKIVLKVVKVWLQFQKLLLNVVKGIIKFVKDANEKFQEFKDGVEEKAEEIKKFFTEDIPQAWEDFKAKAEEIFNNLKTSIEERINAILDFFRRLKEDPVQTLSDLANEVGLFINRVVTFIAELPGKVQEQFELFRQKVEEKFEEIKSQGETKANEFVTGIIDFIRTLPGKIRDWFENTKQRVIEKWEEIKTTGRQKAQEFVDGAIQFVKELPTKVKNWIDETRKKIVEGFNDFVTKAKTFGEDFVNGIIQGIKNLGPNIKNTLQGYVDDAKQIFNSFISGLTGNENNAKGGLMGYYNKGGLIGGGGNKALGFASGGVVPGKSLGVSYAQNGLFQASGTDIIPAMLTPGELVLPRNLTSQLIKVLKRITQIRGVSSTGTGISSSEVGGLNDAMNINIGTVYASNENQARKRSGDIGYGISNYLKSKGK